MKKIFYLFLTLIVFITSTGFRGCNSFFCLIIARLSSLTFTVDNNVFGVGEDGAISVFTDKCWTFTDSVTDKDLNDVNISEDSLTIDNSVYYPVYIVGESGTVLRSLNNGQIWQNISVPYPNNRNLNGFDFLPTPPIPPYIVAVGDSGTVVRSTGSGANWLARSINTTNNLNSVVVVSSDIWIAVGGLGMIYRTANGGQSWQSSFSFNTNTLNRIIKIRYDTYIAVGNSGKIIMSSTYGNSWVLRTSGTTKNLRDALFKNINEGVVAGDDGTVRHTTNGGLTWLTDPYLNGLTTRDILSIAKVDSVTVNSITRDLSTSDNSGTDTTFFIAVSSEPFLGIEPLLNLISDVFGLKQNYPNPFNPVTNIEISIPKLSYVKLVIYDVQGK